MSRNKTLIYVILIIVAFVGTLMDWLLWLSGESAVNPAVFVHAEAIMIGTLLWQFADAKERSIKAGFLCSAVTVIFAPLGSAIYLHRSRGWRAATGMYAAFWGGLVLAVIVANYAGNWVATNVIFGDVPGSG